MWFGRCGTCVKVLCVCSFFFFKQKTAYEMRISDWSSDVCSSDLHQGHPPFRSRSIIDRTGLPDKFGQFRRARARRGLPSRAARTTPIDFAPPSPSRASPAGQSRRPQAAASPKGVRKMEATTDQIATVAALNDIEIGRAHV